MSAALDPPATVDVRAPSEQEEGSQSRILRWLKTVGEAVAAGEPLVEIETDKVTVEIAAPAAGVLAEMLKAEQEEVAPGDLLARIRRDRGAIDAPVPDGAAASTPSSIRSSKPSSASERALASEAAARLAPTADARVASRLSPAVKRLLAEHGLDPAAIRGSGAGGRLTVDDVLRHVSGRRAAAAPVPADSAPPDRRATEAAPVAACSVPASASAESRAMPRDSAPEISPAAGPTPSGSLVPHSPTRRRIAEHMVRSLLHTAPHVTTLFEADYSAVLAHRDRHRDDFASRGVSLTLTAYILAACVDAIRAVPEANARWRDDALELLEPIHIGVGTAVGGKGLIVPVVRDVPALDLFGIASELGRLVALAREDRLAPADVRGGTFTVSNHGVSGSLLAAPIVILQPQVAILGVGKVERRPVVIEEEDEERIVARPRGYLTLTIDHRVMDGDRANHFLAALVKRLESWPA